MDIATTAKDLATGDIIGLVQKLMRIDSDEIKTIIQTLGQKGLRNLGLTALAAAEPVYAEVDWPKGGNSKLGKAFRHITNILGKSNGVQELIGEMGAWMMARLMNFRNPELPVFPTVHGPDIFARQKNTGVWAMIEAKGGTSKLSKEKTKYGLQMQWDWINHWYRKLAEDNAGKTVDGNDLYGSYFSPPGVPNQNPIVAVVLSLNLNRRKDHLRMGVQVWATPSNSWNPWKKGF